MFVCMYAHHSSGISSLAYGGRATDRHPTDGTKMNKQEAEWAPHGPKSTNGSTAGESQNPGITTLSSIDLHEAPLSARDDLQDGGTNDNEQENREHRRANRKLVLLRVPRYRYLAPLVDVLLVGCGLQSGFPRFTH